jgi:hypothetical protein
MMAYLKQDVVCHLLPDSPDGRSFWQGVYQLAHKENLVPLLYGILRHQSVLPIALEKTFSIVYYRNACRNSLLFRESALLIHALQQQGIHVLVLKGAALAEVVYRDIALRPMSDIDLLVQPRQLVEARQVLSALGFRLIGMELHTGYTEEFRSEETWCKVGAVNVAIDLHWGLFNRLYYQNRLPLDWLWKTAQPLQIDTTSTHTLGTSAQVLYLCAHLLLHHDGEGYLWFQDIAEIITAHPTLNWEEILAQAEAWNLVIPLKYCLTVLADRWQVSIPKTVLTHLSRLEISPAETKLSRHLASRHLGISLRLFLADLSGAANWQQRLRFAWNTLFPTRSYMQQRFQIPKTMPIWIYYPYRWLRALYPKPSKR